MNTPRQNALQRLNKRSISAKDIANQFWCEKQMELYYTDGEKQTYVMQQGSAIHEKMQSEVYVPLCVEPASWADRLYKTAYENILTLNTLKKDKLGREFKVYGSLNAYSIAGQIDEFRMVDGKVVVVENKTTNAGRKLGAEYTRPHIVQVMLYRKLLDDIRSRSYSVQNFTAYYKLDSLKLSDGFVEGLKSIGFKDNLIGLREIYERMFDDVAALPELSDDLVVHYLDRETKGTITEMAVKYDREAINKDVIYAMKYWSGEREAAQVPEGEKWKCNMCRFFGKQCKRWWNG